jgi:hypothetical protein
MEAPSIRGQSHRRSVAGLLEFSPDPIEPSCEQEGLRRNPKAIPKGVLERPAADSRCPTQIHDRNWFLVVFSDQLQTPPNDKVPGALGRCGSQVRLERHYFDQHLH